MKMGSRFGRMALATLLCAGVVPPGPCAAAAAAGPAQARPNIVFILADDLGYGDLGCYGQARILTPNIDRLAREGTRFTQVYAGAPVCAPSRCVLMTGLHNGHTRIRDNSPHGIFLRKGDLTIAEVLKGAGYRTGAVGKWSLGVQGSEGKPNDQGFDDWFGHLDQDQAHFYYPDHLWDNDSVVLLRGNRGEQRKDYTHDLFTERALRFVRESRDGPFFLYLAYTIPHWSDFPLQSDESLLVPSDEPYSNRDWPQVEKKYAAMITRMDRDVGRLLALLEERGLDERTIVFVSSDNGPSAEAKHRPAFFRSAGPLRGVKREVYEGGIRVPMVVRWPGRVPAGRVSDAVWAFCDVLPTLAELAGTPPPPGIDGISMRPALLGQDPPRHEYLYWDYGHARGNYKQAVRLGDWKGVRNGPDAPSELYELKGNVGEARNVADSHPDVVGRIARIMTEARTDHPGYPIVRRPPVPRAKAE